MKVRKEDYLMEPWIYVVVPPTNLKQLSPFLATSSGVIYVVTKLSYANVIPHYVEYLRHFVPDQYKEEVKASGFYIIDFYPVRCIGFEE